MPKYIPGANESSYALNSTCIYGTFVESTPKRWPHFVLGHIGIYCQGGQMYIKTTYYKLEILIVIIIMIVIIVTYMIAHILCARQHRRHFLYLTPHQLYKGDTSIIFTLRKESVSDLPKVTACSDWHGQVLTPELKHPILH